MFLPLVKVTGPSSLLRDEDNVDAKLVIISKKKKGGTEQLMKYRRNEF